MTFLVFLKKFMHEYKKKLAKRKEKDLRDRRRLSNFFTTVVWMSTLAVQFICGARSEESIYSLGSQSA